MHTSTCMAWHGCVHTAAENSKKKKKWQEKLIVAPVSFDVRYLCLPSISFERSSKAYLIIFFVRFCLLFAVGCWLTADCCCCVGSSILLIRYEFGLLQPKGSYSSHILMNAAAYVVRWSHRQISLKFLPSPVRSTNGNNGPTQKWRRQKGSKPETNRERNCVFHSILFIPFAFCV